MVKAAPDDTLDRSRSLPFTNSKSLEITTSCGRGTRGEPEAIRAASSRQIETLIFEEGVDISTLKIYDLGCLRDCIKSGVIVNQNERL